MASIMEMLSNERALLGDPNPMSPNPRAQWRSMLAHIQSMYNQISNSNQNWTVHQPEIVLTVAPNTDEYLIPNLVGKPILVFTSDSSNPGHIERPVNVVDLNDLLLTYDGPRNGWPLWGGYWDGSKHTAQGFAFYQKGGSWYVRMRPVPQDAADYKILCSEGNWTAGAAPGSVPVLPEHHHLLTVRTALSDLPNCEWGDISAKSTDSKKAEAWKRNFDARSKILLGENEIFSRDFQLYIRSLTQPRVTFRHSGFYY